MDSEKPIDQTRRGRRVGLLAPVLVLLIAALTFAVLALLMNISLRKQEAREIAFKVVDLDEQTVDPAIWGRNFPRQYDAYLRTVDVERTRYGGSEAFDKLERNPLLRTLFAGYAFSIEFREERGHAYMLSDQRETERVHAVTQPGACIHCHSSNTVAYRKVGLEAGAPGNLTDPLLSDTGKAQLMAGFEKVCAMPFEQATGLVDHAVSCIECHDPQTLALRVTRPAFLEGIRRLAESDDSVSHLPSIERWRRGPRKSPYDPNTEASWQEMRSFVCGQCHVEYYFKGEGKLLTYPWHKGLKAEQVETHYDEVGFKDWTHKIAGTATLKAQHPEFEMWNQGIHARSGVACADCHMPYIREGAIKISDHQVRSPMLNVARACQVCHRFSEEEMRSRVEQIQDRTHGLLQRAERATAQLIEAIGRATEAGVDEDRLAAARALHRKAQWRTDFVNAENSMGFHAPQESARLLAEAIDYARLGELELTRHQRPGAED